MKCIYVLFVVVAAASAAYDTTYDNEDIDAVVADVPTLTAFVDCFVDLGPCDKIPAHYKKDIGHAIEHNCEECNERQQYLITTFVTSLKAKIPEKYEIFQAKFDPDNKNLAFFLH